MAINQGCGYAKVHLLTVLIRILLALFFLFVGYWKALGPIEKLAEHGAWVAEFPDWFARSAGWAEIVCAIMLLAPARFAVGTRYPLVIIGAVGLLINQVAALATHSARAEFSMILQNITLMTLLVFTVAVVSKCRGSTASRNPVIF